MLPGGFAAIAHLMEYVGGKYLRDSKESIQQNKQGFVSRYLFIQLYVIRICAESSCTLCPDYKSGEITSIHPPSGCKLLGLECREHLVFTVKLNTRRLSRHSISRLWLFTGEGYES